MSVHTTRLPVAIALAGLFLVAVVPASSNAQITQAEYAARRAALTKGLPGDGVLLVLGGKEPKENYQNFWQAENFNYLTGFLEPESALIIVRKDGVERSMLFVEPTDPAAEVWTGARLGVQGVKTKLGMEGRDASTLRAVLDSLVAGGGTLFTIGDFSNGGGADVPAAGPPRTADDQFVDKLKLAHRNVTVKNVAANVMKLRATKSPAELALLRSAAKVSAKAHLEVLHAIAPGMNEFEIQALAEYTFRRNGGDGPSYGSIVGSGPNSTTLHYNKDDRYMKAGEVLNMDMATYYGGYAADITRTVPVSGTFSREQKDIYQIVFDAQAAAERQVKVGNRFSQLSDSATAVLRTGLTAVGLIEGPGATYECSTEGAARKCPQLGLFYMHGLGHPIGLDVHDVDQYNSGVLAEGSVFTIEPGVYVRENLLDIVPNTPGNAAYRSKLATALRKYANVGVRIEDDYIVTATGYDRITSDAPRTIDEIEREMAKKSGPAARDAEAVDAYKKIRP